MNRIRITSLRGTKQSRVKINEITNNSGLPRRSFLTARNDDVRFRLTFHVIARNEAIQKIIAIKKIKRIIVQTNKPQPKKSP